MFGFDSKCLSDLLLWIEPTHVVCVIVTVVIMMLFKQINSKQAINTINSTDANFDPQKVLQLIKTRRSISPKEFDGRIICDTHIKMLLEASNWAPTHGKTEPWRYTVIAGHHNFMKYFEFIENWYIEHAHELSEEDMNTFRKKYCSVVDEWQHKVSHILVICMKRQADPEKLMPKWEETCAVAISVQNIHLLASSLKIGAFWSSHTWCKQARESKEMKAFLGLKNEDKIFGALILGHYNENKTYTSTRTPIENKLQWWTS